MGIESYSVVVTAAEKNILTVDFVILGKAMEPKDFQPILDELKAFCEKFNSANQISTTP